MADGTKELLGRALKSQLLEMPLDKVTVSRLARETGITRQAFYYHFANIYELAAWVFEAEIASHIMAHASYRDWARGFEELLTYMRKHQTEVEAIPQSLSRYELEKFFYRQFCEMMAAIVRDVAGGEQIDDHTRRKVIRHFSVVVLGYFVHWLATGMEEDPAQLVPGIEELLHGQVREALGIKDS